MATTVTVHNTDTTYTVHYLLGNKIAILCQQTSTVYGSGSRSLCPGYAVDMGDQPLSKASFCFFWRGILVRFLVHCEVDRHLARLK